MYPDPAFVNVSRRLQFGLAFQNTKDLRSTYIWVGSHEYGEALRKMSFTSASSINYEICSVLRRELDVAKKTVSLAMYSPLQQQLSTCLVKWADNLQSSNCTSLQIYQEALDLAGQLLEYYKQENYEGTNKRRLVNIHALANRRLQQRSKNKKCKYFKRLPKTRNHYHG